MLKRKTNQSTNSPFVWTEISKALTGKPENIRQNRIPKTHEAKIEQLEHYFKCWKQDKQLYTMDEIKEKLSKLDLNTIVLDIFK